MKKLLLIAIVSLVTFASCTKAGKLNRRLDGKWTAVSYDGQAVSSDFSMTIEFNKDKKGEGSYTTTVVFTVLGVPSTSTETGTYVLTKDETITMTDSNGTSKSTVTDYSKTDLTLTDEDGTVIVLKKA